ncbi:hypothetical protein Tco_1400085 [Tanacetum coccineum]
MIQEECSFKNLKLLNLIPPPCGRKPVDAFVAYYLRQDCPQAALETWLSHERHTGDGARRIDMTEQDIETLRARAEAAEQRADTLQVSLGAARIDVEDLIESREADRLEMAELRSRAQEMPKGWPSNNGLLE